MTARDLYKKNIIPSDMKSKRSLTNLNEVNFNK